MASDDDPKPPGTGKRKKRTRTDPSQRTVTIPPKNDGDAEGGGAEGQTPARGSEAVAVATPDTPSALAVSAQFSAPAIAIPPIESGPGETSSAVPSEPSPAASSAAPAVPPQPAASTPILATPPTEPLPTLPDSDEPAAGEAGTWRVSAAGIPSPVPALPAVRIEPAPGASGSIDVQVSAPNLPKQVDAAASAELAAQKVGESGKLTAAQATALVVKEAARKRGTTGAPPTSEGSLPASASGSVDVALSATGVPVAVGASDSQPTSQESQPVSGSGAVAAVAPNEGSGPVRGQRTKRITASIQGALSGGVERLGHGIGVVGEGVSKLGDFTNKVPVVGASVGRLGEGIAKAGESIHALPRVAQTRRGRLLVRSVVVGFLLVFTWIAVIVGFQLRANDTPDFRPAAERILIEMGQGPGSIAQVYEHASPRFQELVKKERFLDDMADLYATNGKFREVSAINETLVTTGPTGKVGRVGLTASFEKGISRGSISFHWDKGEWKLLGLGIEVPDNVEITQIERQKRVAACIDDKGNDTSDQRTKCLVRDAAETILEMIRDNRAGEVWDNANDIFKQQESRLRFIQIQEEQRGALGNWKRILNVTDARAIAGLTSAFDIVCEYERSSGVRVQLDFTRSSKYELWKLARFKVTVPMPRPTELPATEPSIAPPAPAMPAIDAGVAPSSPRR